MAKRFTDTEKWEDPWFRKLPSKHQKLWLFILDRCDSAGVWKVDFELAGFLIGERLKLEEASPFFKNRVVPFDDGEKWFIPKFLDFQYGHLDENCRPHKYVIKVLIRHGLYEGYQKGIDTLKDKSKDKEQDKDKEKDGEEHEKGIEQAAPRSPRPAKSESGSAGHDLKGFPRFWVSYPKKRSKGQAEKAWSKLKPDELLQDRILHALELAKTSVDWKKNGGEFIPYPATWLNAKGWEDEFKSPGPPPERLSVKNEMPDRTTQPRWDYPPEVQELVKNAIPGGRK